MKVDRNDLLAALRLAYGAPAFGGGPGVLSRDVATHFLRARLPFDLPAALLATILWESGGRLGVEGDGGDSHGLAQIHAPSWPDLPPFEMPAHLVDAETGADIEDERGYMIRALGYELAYIRPVVVENLKALKEALDITRTRAAAGEPIRLNVARDLPVWWSIVWQYGAPSLERWLASPQANDLTPAGFAAFRRAHGLKVLADYESRQKFFAETYLHSIADTDALLDALREESISSGVDFYSRAAKTLGAKAADVEAWMQGAGKKLLFPWLPDARDVAIGLGSVALLAVVAYQLLTVETKRGREVRPEIKAKIKEVAAVAAPAVLAKILL